MTTALSIVVPALPDFTSPLSSPRCDFPKVIATPYDAPLRDHDQHIGKGLLHPAALATARERMLGTRLGSPRWSRGVAAFVSFADDAEAAAEASDVVIQDKRRALLGCRHGSPLRSAAVAATLAHGDVHGDGPLLLPKPRQHSRLQWPATCLSGGLDAINDVNISAPPPRVSLSEPGSPSRSQAARIYRRLASAKEPLASSAAGDARATSTDTATCTALGRTSSAGPALYRIGVPIRTVAGSPGQYNQCALERAWSDMADY